MKFFKFRQNNSGGSFEGFFSIFIEADSEKEAIEIAEKDTQIYFDGCSRNIDCNCCGDRWSTYCDELVFESFNDLISSVIGYEIIYYIKYRQEYTLEKFAKEMFWGLDCMIFLKDKTEIKFNGFGRVIEENK